ncbi:hypothetical protein [Streptomyces sp. NPDC051662]|uniref:hypothetical protein n=1 Tax=Streptomyces sp. NPDC051662 TaxID=3154750 RepID=UPI00341A7826
MSLSRTHALAPLLRPLLAGALAVVLVLKVPPVSYADGTGDGTGTTTGWPLYTPRVAGRC